MIDFIPHKRRATFQYSTSGRLHFILRKRRERRATFHTAQAEGYIHTAPVEGGMQESWPKEARVWPMWNNPTRSQTIGICGFCGSNDEAVGIST